MVPQIDTGDSTMFFNIPVSNLSEKYFTRTERTTVEDAYHYQFFFLVENGSLVLQCLLKSHCDMIVKLSAEVVGTSRKVSVLQRIYANSSLTMSTDGLAGIEELKANAPSPIGGMVQLKYSFVVDILDMSAITQRAVERERIKLYGPCDVKIGVDNIEINAHRKVLARKSQVLDRIFSAQSLIKISNFEADIVQLAVDFCYLEAFGDDIIGVCSDLFQFAHVYDMPELTNYVTMSLVSVVMTNGMDTSDVQRVRLIADRKGIQALKFACEEHLELVAKYARVPQNHNRMLY